MEHSALAIGARIAPYKPDEDHEHTVRMTDARRAAARYFGEYEKEARRLGFPTITAFYKERSKGTVSLLPTPDDQELDTVGDFLKELSDINRRAMVIQFDRIADHPAHVRAKRAFGWNRDKFNKRIKMLLGWLAGMLM
jgi:hypothetical protein